MKHCVVVCSVVTCFWMCRNYVQITTDYNDAKNCSECFALQQFSAGEEVFTSCCIIVIDHSNTFYLLI